MSILEISWDGNTKGQGKIIGDNGHMDIAIPKSLDGSGKGFNPKDLLASAAASCFATTLVHLLEVRKIPVTVFNMKTEVENNEHGFVITHSPELILLKDEKDAARRAVEAADRSCGIGNLLKDAGVQITIKETVSILKS